MKNFECYQYLWIVVKHNGSIAGTICVSEEEAEELANQHEGAKIFKVENLCPHQ